MFESITAFFAADGNRLGYVFYAVIILLIYFNRKKLDWQGIIGMYKTKIGIKLMQRIATKHRKLVQRIGYVGIPVGFLGMLFILFSLIKGLWDLIKVPEAAPTMSLVLPGISVDGLIFGIPLITGLLALFTVIVVHEFSHGVVSKAHGIPIESSGLFFLGPITGAFVEPNEKKLAKADDWVQMSIFAAGPWSNILSTIVFIFLFAITGMLAGGMIDSTNLVLSTVTPGFPADEAGIMPDTVIVEAQGIPVANQDEFKAAVSDVEPGDTLSLVDENGVTYEPVVNDAGLIGVGLGIKTSLKQETTWYAGVFFVLQKIYWFFFWVWVLNIGIGLANLLPLGPVDGGQMLRTLSCRWFGEKKGMAFWKQMSMFTLVLLLLTVLILPLIRMALF